MNNKDEKTFADLFSNSTLEDETNKEQTFSNIFKNQNETTEESNVKDLTFDNITDTIQKEKIDNKVDIFSQNTKEKEEITEKKSLDNIFEKISSDLESSSHDNLMLEENNINPFFEKQESVIEVSSSETKNEETETNVNPFFEEEQINEQKDSEIISSSETKNEEVETNVNPFLEENIMPKIELNFKETPSQETMETKQNENNFESSINELENKLKKEKNKEEKSELTSQEEVKKSTSPFFEEEKKEANANPFFQGQLSLVENKEHNNPINNIDISKSKHFDVKIVKKKESALKFIIGVFSYAIFIFLLLIGVTLLVYVLDTKIRAAKGDYSSPTFNAYVVLTGSMLPSIQVNDVVITKKVEASKLNEGDVITFASADSRFQGTIITHRIIKKNPPDGTNNYTFQTKGDNNNVADSALVPAANIYGKVILKIPKLGYLQEFLATRGGWIIVILFPCLIVISYDIVKLVKGLKRKKYKNIKVQK